MSGEIKSFHSSRDFPELLLKSCLADYSFT